MSSAFPSALRLSRAVLSALIPLNLLAGGLILALLIASGIAEVPVMRALGVRVPEDQAALIQGMRLIMVIGIGAVPLGHMVLTRLRAIVSSVDEGDPFVPANARRLNVIAWTLLSMEILHLAVIAVARWASVDIHAGLSVTGWLAVLLLFVLARVFEHGARLREDVEGTV